MDKNENADNILKFKREDPEQFHCLVKKSSRKRVKRHLAVKNWRKSLKTIAS